MAATIMRQKSTVGITRMMRAVNCERPGPAESLRVNQVPTPLLPNDTDVLIAVRAAGISRPDVYQRQGVYPPPFGVTNILGLEVAGTVVEKGSKSKWNIGDEVCALVPGGGYAEFCVADSGSCLPIPFSSHDHHSGSDALDPFVKAAALPETVFTVHKNLFSKVEGSNSINLKKGEKLLIHGGTSGIGMTAIALATLKGVEVYTTSRSKEKCDACLKMGAKGAFLSTDPNKPWEKALKDATDGGVDAILDYVGGAYLQKNIDVLNKNGRLCLIGFLLGPISTANMTRVMFKSLHITGSVLRSQPNSLKAELSQEIEKEIWPLIKSGKFNPVIDTVYPDLAGCVAAHSRMEQANHIGKVVLKVPMRQASL